MKTIFLSVGFLYATSFFSGARFEEYLSKIDTNRFTIDQCIDLVAKFIKQPITMRVVHPIDQEAKLPKPSKVLGKRSRCRFDGYQYECDCGTIYCLPDLACKTCEIYEFIQEAKEEDKLEICNQISNYLLFWLIQWVGTECNFQYLGQAQKPIPKETTDEEVLQMRLRMRFLLAVIFLKPKNIAYILNLLEYIATDFKPLFLKATQSSDPVDRLINSRAQLLIETFQENYELIKTRPVKMNCVIKGYRCLDMLFASFISNYTRKIYPLKDDLVYVVIEGWFKAKEPRLLQEQPNSPPTEILPGPYSDDSDYSQGPKSTDIPPRDDRQINPGDYREEDLKTPSPQIIRQRNQRLP